jgi:hypothetical protein
MSEHARDFKRVRKAIKDRDLQEMCWEMLSMSIDDIESTGKAEIFGKTGLMELIRVLSIQKNTENMSERMDKVTEMKEWLRKQG